MTVGEREIAHLQPRRSVSRHRQPLSAQGRAAVRRHRRRRRRRLPAARLEGEPGDGRGGAAGRPSDDCVAHLRRRAWTTASSRRAADRAQRRRRQRGMTSRAGFCRAGHLADAGRGAALLRRQLHGVGAARAARAVPARAVRPDARRSRACSSPIPLLGGSLFRPVLGVLGDRIGGRRAGLIGLALTLVAAASLGWTVRARRRGTSTCSGSSSASPAPASPWRCRWPAAGIRRSTRAWRWASPAPATRHRCWRRCSRRGWPSASAGRTTFGLAMLPVVVRRRSLFALLAKDSPTPARATTLARLRRRAARARHALVFVPLQPDVRRLRRLRQLPDDVLPRAVPACRG